MPKYKYDPNLTGRQSLAAALRQRDELKAWLKSPEKSTETPPLLELVDNYARRLIDAMDETSGSDAATRSCAQKMIEDFEKLTPSLEAREMFWGAALAHHYVDSEEESGDAFCAHAAAKRLETLAEWGYAGATAQKVEVKSLGSDLTFILANEMPLAKAWVEKWVASAPAKLREKLWTEIIVEAGQRSLTDPRQAALDTILDGWTQSKLGNVTRQRVSKRLNSIRSRWQKHLTDFGAPLAELFIKTHTNTPKCPGDNL